MLFVVALTGAEPILVGGGELARDIDAEVIEALSDTASLVGLLGRSSLEVDARLAWRIGGNVGGNMDVTEVGVALPPPGVSVFGVDVTRKLLVTFLARGDWTVGPVVVVGSGGNALGAPADLEADSVTMDTLGFGGTEIFRLDAARFSPALGAVCEDRAPLVVVGCFLAVVAEVLALTELIALVAAGVVGVFPLLTSSAGKSSDCKAACAACEAIVLESPLLEARCCTSCFACDISVSEVELGAMRAGVAGMETLESGVAA